MKQTYKYIFFAVALSIFAACSSTSKLDRSMVPEAGPAPQIQLGDYDLFTLENGLKVIVVQNNKLPRVSYSITVNRDPLFEGDKAGYVEMAGSLMRNGTTSMSKAQIDEEVDFMGASLSTYSSGMFGSSLTKHSDNLLGIMSDVLLHPSFPEDEIEKLRKQTLSGLISSKTSADDISGNITRAMTYGLDHPYGEQQTEETTEAITRDDLVNYYQTYFRPNISYLVIVGDITPEDAKSQAEKYFGSWEKKEVPTHDYNLPNQPESNRVAFVPVPGAVQSVIDITYPVNLKPGSDDAIAANVMNSILGGGAFSGRLMQNLREDKAYTYGARSSLSSDDLVGNFSAYASVRNDVTDSAIVQFLYELDRISTELVPDSTVEFVKNGMAGSFARSLESPQTIARFAYNIERYGLPKDYYQTYLQKLEAVNAEDVLAMAKRYIKPNNCYITVVGNKDEVADKLDVLAGSGSVEFYDMYGKEYNDLKPAPEGVTAKTVLNNYIEAIGGEDKIAAVKSFVQMGAMMMGPMALGLEIKMKDHQKFMMTMSMSGQPMMEQKFDGTKGSVSQMGQTMVVEGPELEDMKYEGDMLLEARFEDYGINAELKGIGEMSGEEAYVIEVTYPLGRHYTEYYSVASGLKLQRSQTSVTPEGSFTATSTFNEYKEYNGVKFAVSVTQAVGPQTMELKIEDVKVNEKLKDSEFAVTE